MVPTTLAVLSIAVTTTVVMAALLRSAVRAAVDAWPSSLMHWDHVQVDDFLVTVKIRVTVTDPQSLLKAWHDGDPTTAEKLSNEPEMSLTLALQNAVKPPDLSSVTGVVPRQADGLFASVKAEPWREGLDPW